MSNACVINATHNSGQTAGVPVTIEAGGDVVLKAFGSGSGAWSVTLAFAPYTNESPVTLTISNVSPSARTSVVSTGATSWVGWVVSQSGEWEASGVVEGYQPDEALAGDLGVFVPGTAPTKAIKAGATYRDTSGTQYTYGGAGAGWVDVGLDISPLDYGVDLWDDALQATNSASGYYVRESTGALVGIGQGYFASDYIACAPGDKIKIVYRGTAPVQIGAFYTGAGVYVAGVGASYNNGAFGVVFIAPAGAYKFRISYLFAPIVMKMTGVLSKLSTVLSAVGDSITAAFGTTNGKSWANYAAERVGYSVQNLGISGSTIANLAGHDPIALRISAINKDARKIVIFAGVNDCIFGVPIGAISDAVDTTFYGALNIICQYLNANFPLADVMLATPINAGTAVTNYTLLPNYQEAIRLIANKYSIRLIDAGRESGINFLVQSHNDAYCHDTSLHPNDYGQQVLGDFFARKLV